MTAWCWPIKVETCRCNKEYLSYVYGSVHRWSILIIVQQDATQSSLFIILQVHSTCFGCQPHPSWVHKTVTTAFGTGHTLEGGSCTKNMISTGGCSYSFVYSSWPHWREVAAQKIWQVPEAAVTVLCTPDDGCGWHPKHVEWTCRIINRLLCVASRWTIINIVPELLVSTVFISLLSDLTRTQRDVQL